MASNNSFLNQFGKASPEGASGQPLMYFVKKLQNKGIKTFLSTPQKGVSNGTRPQQR